MRENKVPESKSKLRLLDAAEQLFAERGFDVVSVRDVTQLAEANVAAVNYHFGSREGLVTLVATRCINPVILERLARLDVLERKWSGKSAPLEEIMDAFVRPVAGVVRKSELSENLSVKLVGRVLALQGDAVPESLEEPFKNSNARFIRSLGKALPSLSADELQWRLHFVTGALVHLLVNRDVLQRGGSVGESSMEVLLGRFIRFAVAGLREGVEIEPVAKKGPQAMFDF